MDFKQCTCGYGVMLLSYASQRTYFDQAQYDLRAIRLTKQLKKFKVL